MTDSVCQHNLAASGGAVALAAGAVATLANCTLTMNTAVQQGGGVACLQCGSLLLATVVKHNAAPEVRLLNCPTLMTPATLHAA